MTNPQHDDEEKPFVVSTTLLHRGLGVSARYPREEDIRYDYIANKIQTHRVAYFGLHETDLAFLVADTPIAEEANDGKVTVAIWYPESTINYLTGAQTALGKPWSKAKRKEYDQEQRDRIEEYLNGTAVPSPIRGAFAEDPDGDLVPINILQSTIFEDYNLDPAAFKTVAYFDRYALLQEVMDSAGASPWLLGKALEAGARFLLVHTLITVRGLLAGALSIFVHGLSIPALIFIYKFYGVQLIAEDAVKIKCVSIFTPPTVNAIVNGSQNYMVHNLFSRPAFNQCKLPLCFWSVAFRMNKSCLPYCRRSFIGDMFIVCGTQGLASGTRSSRSTTT
ncbi:Cation/H+ exchanger [Apiospora saccharicola]